MLIPRLLLMHWKLTARLDVIDELDTGTAGDDATEMAVNVGKDAGGAKTAAAAATAVTGGENEQLDADVETPEEVSGGDVDVAKAGVGGDNTEGGTTTEPDAAC